MQYSILREPDRELLRQAVRLHHEALSYRSFITSFGEEFLLRVYEGILEMGLGFLVIAKEGPTLAGFILACTDSARLMSVVARRPLRFAPIMVARFLRRPDTLPKLLQTLLYSKREGSDVAAELVVIAVSAQLRSAGIGKRMLCALDGEFLVRGIDTYKVTVHEEMAASNRFYVQNGMTLDRTFEMYGVTWNLYVQRIESTREAAP